MPEHFKPQRYEDRESSKVGPEGYLKHVAVALLPFIGLGLGYVVRKVTKLPFLEKMYGFMPRAEFLGSSLGGAIATYHLWSANTKEQLEVDKITADVEKLRGMESGNQYLARENEQLRQQLRFSERHAPQGTSHVAQAEASKENAAEVVR